MRNEAKGTKDVRVAESHSHCQHQEMARFLWYTNSVCAMNGSTSRHPADSFIFKQQILQILVRRLKKLQYVYWFFDEMSMIKETLEKGILKIIFCHD